MYTLLFLARFFPFWGLPLALVVFEVGMYNYHRRARKWWMICFGMTGAIVGASVLWLVFEGYWRLGPWIKDVLESFGK